ncbi:accessory gene regulator B [Paenibacillaceae bacterium GAS479]|nr:accessory gene regulator B [Paenibacillaceae bacterium GAS479]
MLEQLSIICAQKIKQKHTHPEAANVTIMAYALGVYFNFFATLLLIMLVGWATNELINTILVMLLFNVIRFFSGGYHFKSLDVCVVISVVLFSIVPHLSLSTIGISFLTLSSALIFLWRAPAYTSDTTRLNPRFHPYFKVIAALLALINVQFQSELYAWVLLLQAFTLLFVTKGGESA